MGYSFSKSSQRCEHAVLIFQIIQHTVNAQLILTIACSCRGFEWIKNSMPSECKATVLMYAIVWACGWIRIKLSNLHVCECAPLTWFDSSIIVL
jgi:hypothetical protein